MTPLPREFRSPGALQPLTDRQREVLRYIESYMAEHGWPPTIQEIGDALGLSSKSTVHFHVQALHRKGYIEVGKTQAQQMRVVGS